MGRLTATDENLVCPVFISQLRSITFPGFLQGNKMLAPVGGAGLRDETSWRQRTYKLDSHLLAIEKVHSFEDDAKGALSDLLPHSIMHPNNVRR
jgi:hypothetical protein